VEVPDFWLQMGNPWEIQRNDVLYNVKFYGHVKKIWDNGKERSVWEDGENILAEAYDNPIPGFNTFNSINLRLWKSVPTNEFDFNYFNSGDYFKAIEAR
jgi:starch phosphorylase